MKKSVWAVVITLALFAGCKKNDNAAKWVGTYTDASNASVKQIVITEVDKSTVQMQLQTPSGSSFVTFVTIKGARLSDATDAIVNENGNILPDVVTLYHFSGSAILNGNALSFLGGAVSTSDSTNTHSYTFNGSK